LRISETGEEKNTSGTEGEGKERIRRREGERRGTGGGLEEGSEVEKQERREERKGVVGIRRQSKRVDYLSFFLGRSWEE